MEVTLVGASWYVVSRVIETGVDFIPMKLCGELTEFQSFTLFLFTEGPGLWPVACRV